MTARILHNEEGYTLRVDNPLGDSFPARETSKEARIDYFDHLLYWKVFEGWGSNQKATNAALDLEVVET